MDDRQHLIANNWWRDGCPICGGGAPGSTITSRKGVCQPQSHFVDEHSNAYLRALGASLSVKWNNNCLEELSAIVIEILDKNNNISNAYLKYRFGLTEEETYSLVYHLLDMKIIKLLPIALSQWGITLSEEGKKFLYQVYDEITEERLEAALHLR